MNNPFLASVPLHPRRDSAILAREDVFDSVYKSILAEKFCLILGPKYIGRTTLLRAVKARLQENILDLPVLIQPEELDITGDGAFFDSLACLLQQALRGERAWPADFDLAQYAIRDYPDAFKGFLDDLLQRLDHRLILFFDSIERLPPHPLVKVANIAHTMFVTRDASPFYRNISFNFAGSISLRYLTFTLKPEVSPFNICANIPLRDLTTAQARAFFERIVDKFNLSFSHDSISLIVEWAGGDLNMLQRIASLSMDADDRHVDSRTVRKILDMIVQSDPWRTDESLRNTADLVEEDHQTLHLVLRLLHQPSVPYQPSAVDKALYSAFDITYPEMTGAVVLERLRGEPENWTFRNKVTEMFLRHHFTPQRITRTFLELGQLDDAIRSCDALLNHVREQFEGDMANFNDSELQDVLMAFISRIRAESSHEFGYELMARLLDRGFGFSDATYFEYIEPTHTLTAVEFLSSLFNNDGTPYSVTDEKNRGALEVQAYHSQLFATGRKGDQLQIAIPLKNQIDVVTAVVTIRFSARKKWNNIDVRTRVIKNALQALNIALTQAESSRKNEMIHSLRPPAGKGEPARIFVAHAFRQELLKNLRDYLGRVSDQLTFRYVDVTKSAGFLSTAILAEMRGCRLCLYEVSVPNNNVYFECGLGLGLNLPGILFLRVKKGPVKAPRIPPILHGMLYFNYLNYNSIMEDIAGRLNSALDTYWDNQQYPSFIHFLGVKLPKVSGQRKYAAVLDHDHFGDQADYRNVMDAVFREMGLETAYPLDEGEAGGRYLNKTEGNLPRLVNMINLLQHAEIIVCRVEDIKSSADGHIAGQCFIGLGYAFGLNEIARAKRLNILMTLLNQDNRGRHLDPPADLRGYPFQRYQTLPELRKLMAHALARK
jgi:hypothetical protein